MTDGEENNNTTVNVKPRSKIVDYIKLTSLILCFIIVTAVIFCVYYYASLPKEFSELVDRISKSFTDIPVARFEKFERQPDIHFCDIKGYPVDFKFVMQIAYTGKQIILGNSLLMNTPIKTIDVPGDITTVDCYFKSNFDYNSFDLASECRNVTDGLFIACTYIKNSQQRLVLYRIPYSYFKDYEVYSNFNKEADSKAKKDFEDIINKSKDDAKKYADKIYSLFSDSSSYPYANISKQFDIEFENQKLQGFTVDYKDGAYLLSIDRMNGLIHVIDCNGKTTFTKDIDTKSQVKAITGDVFSEIYNLDKDVIELCAVIDGKLESIAKCNLPKPNYDYAVTILNGSNDLYCANNEFFLFAQDNKIFSLEKNQEYSNSELKTKGLILKAIDNYVNIKYISFRSYSSGKESTYVSYVFDGIDYSFNKVILPYTLLSQYFFNYFLETPKDGATAESVRNRFINLMIGDNGNPIILFNSDSLFKVFNTSGIDEPVDQAHVTYEDGRLTIYFMNKTSIYRWQNSQEGISNLKLRKLDIKSEPIKTIR